MRRIGSAGSNSRKGSFHGCSSPSELTNAIFDYHEIWHNRQHEANIAPPPDSEDVCGEWTVDN